jgi:cytochrome c-type biogenesis protein CcmH
MMGLIFLALFILAGTVWLLVRPWAPAGERHGERYHQLQLVRERLLVQLGELEAEMANQGMDAQVAHDEKRRLEAELADVLRTLEALETSSGDQPAAPTKSARRATVVVFAMGLPLVTALLFIGTNQPIPQRSSSKGAEVAQAPQVPPMVLEMVGRLEKRLAQQPDDPAGWARLGRSYQVLNRIPDAKAAYAKAYQLVPENPEVLSEYAALLYNENPRQTSGQVFTLFSKLRELSPDHPGALWFLGVAAYEKGEFRVALNSWEHLAKQLPADSQVLPQVRHAIAEAHSRLQQ